MLKKSKGRVNKHDIEAHSEEAIKLLYEEETSKPLQKKKVLGDASEAGLIKFVSGAVNMEEVRRRNPIH